MDKNKALIYVRVSTEEQAGEGRYSPDTQKQLCTKYIRESSDFILAEDGIYEDLGRTATNTNRPGLQDMLSRVSEDKSIGLLVVQDTDRLARNLFDHLTIRAHLKKHGATLYSVSQPGIEDTAEGRMMDSMIASFNQFQSDITSRKTIKSMEQRFWDGWPPTKAPIGYLNTGDPTNPDKRIVVLDPVRAPLIKRMFELYSTGNYTMFEIGEILFKKGLTTENGKKLSHSRMFDAISNPFYCGELRWRNMVNPNGKQDQLITRDLFDRCQLIKDHRSRPQSRNSKYRFLFNGYLYSPKGLRYFGEYHDKKGKGYYRAHARGKIKTTEDKPIKIENIEAYVQDAFNGIQFSEYFIDKLMIRVKEIYESKRRETKKETVGLQNKRNSLTEKLETAEEKLISGVLSDSEFTRLKTKLRNDIQLVDDELNIANRSKNIKVDLIQEILLLTRNVGPAYKKAPPMLKSLYLKLFWDRFELSDRKISKAIPSPIIQALVSTGSICLNKKQKPVQMEKAFAYKAKEFRTNIEIANFRGVYRDLNPN